MLGWNEASSRCWRLTPDYHPHATIVLDCRGRVTTRMPMTSVNTCFWLCCTSSIFKLGGWDGPLLLPLLFPLRSRFSKFFSQGERLPLRAVLHIHSSCSNILNPLSTRVWFHVLDCKITCCNGRPRWLGRLSSCIQKPISRVQLSPSAQQGVK